MRSKGFLLVALLWCVFIVATYVSYQGNTFAVVPQQTFLAQAASGITNIADGSDEACGAASTKADYRKGQSAQYCADNMTPAISTQCGQTTNQGSQAASAELAVSCETPLRQNLCVKDCSFHMNLGSQEITVKGLCVSDDKCHASSYTDKDGTHQLSGLTQTSGNGAPAVPQQSSSLTNDVGQLGQQPASPAPIQQTSGSPAVGSGVNNAFNQSPATPASGQTSVTGSLGGGSSGGLGQTTTGAGSVTGSIGQLGQTTSVAGQSSSVTGSLNSLGSAPSLNSNLTGTTGGLSGAGSAQSISSGGLATTRGISSAPTTFSGGGGISSVARSTPTFSSSVSSGGGFGAALRSSFSAPSISVPSFFGGIADLVSGLVAPVVNIVVQQQVSVQQSAPAPALAPAVRTLVPATPTPTPVAVKTPTSVTLSSPTIEPISNTATAPDTSWLISTNTIGISDILSAASSPQPSFDTYLNLDTASDTSQSSSPTTTYSPPPALAALLAIQPQSQPQAPRQNPALDALTANAPETPQPIASGALPISSSDAFTPSSFTTTNASPTQLLTIEDAHSISLPNLLEAITSGSIQNIRDVLGNFANEITSVTTIGGGAPTTPAPTSDLPNTAGSPPPVGQSSPVISIAPTPAAPSPFTSPAGWVGSGSPSALWNAITSPQPTVFEGSLAPAPVTFQNAGPTLPDEQSSATTSAPAPAVAISQVVKTVSNSVSSFFGNIASWVSGLWAPQAQTNSISSQQSGGVTVHLLASPPSIPVYTQTTLYWSSEGADDCVISSGNGAHIAQGTEGSTLTPQLSAQTTFSATCTAGTSTVSTSVAVRVQ